MSWLVRIGESEYLPVLYLLVHYHLFARYPTLSVEASMPASPTCSGRAIGAHLVCGAAIRAAKSRSGANRSHTLRNPYWQSLRVHLTADRALAWGDWAPTQTFIYYDNDFLLSIGK